MTTKATTLTTAASARAAGLRYVTDESRGIARRRIKAGFRYLDSDGKPIRDQETLSRIRKLAIPPAYDQVWICPHPDGHLQATGRDARGRKQYRYHPRWRAVRDDNKFERMLGFGQALPKIRAGLDQDLSRPGLPREKVLATVLRLLELTLIRVGNEEYARTNHSYGLTTLRSSHVTIAGTRLRFSFRGKSGKHHVVSVTDRKLARTVRRCHDLPGQELFQYLAEDGTQHSIHSHDVNDYLRALAGAEFTAKDFRTWAGSVLAARALSQLLSSDGKATHKGALIAVRSVAERLGNTPAVCRKSYIHPEVFASYHRQSLMERMAGADDGIDGLGADELAFLRLVSQPDSDRIAA